MLLGLAPVSPTMAQAPQRVVTVNLCLDLMALRLAAPGQLVGVSSLSHQPGLSVLADLARTVAAVRPTAESILDLQPDLVIFDQGTHAGVKRLLRQAGVPILEVPFATSLEEAEPLIERMATALGREDEGRRLIDEMRTARQALVWNKSPVATAIALQANRGTAGRGSLMDELLRLAGLRNLAAEWGMPAFGRLSLETILAGKPDMLVVDGESNADPARATELVEHHALKALAVRARIVSVPMRAQICAGPENFEVLRLLAEARP